MGRLRKALRAMADVSATQRGFALVPRRDADVVVLAQPVDAKHAEVLALLADGESYEKHFAANGSSFESHWGQPAPAGHARGQPDPRPVHRDEPDAEPRGDGVIGVT